MPSPLWVEGERDGEAILSPGGEEEKGERWKDPLTPLALRASVNGLTDSPFVLYGAHYSSHQHPSPPEERVKEMRKS
jgi:hypothetical protein